MTFYIMGSKGKETKIFKSVDMAIKYAIKTGATFVIMEDNSLDPPIVWEKKNVVSYKDQKWKSVSQDDSLSQETCDD